jgi:hypothetical protein
MFQTIVKICGKFTDQTKYYQLFKNDTAPTSCLLRSTNPCKKAAVTYFSFIFVQAPLRLEDIQANNLR